VGRRWTVGEVAELAHVTVRTLHHYDAVGLLAPSERSEAGYRLYGQADLERLHEILLFRKLGFSLDAIGQLLDEPAFDRRSALRAQRGLLAGKMKKTEGVIRAIDATLEAIERGATMDAEQMFEGLQGFDEAQWAEEAERRWGHTDAYQESMRRVQGYTKETWSKVKAEADAVMTEMAALMAEGESADGDEAADVAEKHRLHIDRWFYPCDHTVHAALADMYEADARFGTYFEKRAKGLAAYVAAAIRANAARGA
jgi:DNA-binding transcriptional MerR regulator